MAPASASVITVQGVDVGCLVPRARRGRHGPANTGLIVEVDLWVRVPGVSPTRHRTDERGRSCVGASDRGGGLWRSGRGRRRIRWIYEASDALTLQSAI